MQAVILTGIVAGFVHVVSGAEHLIAMAPAAINNPQKALKNSFSWGLGHSSGVLLIAFLAIFIKDITPLNKFSSLAEFLVGISLLIVGVFSIKNSFQLSIHSHSHKHENGIAQRHFHFHVKQQNNLPISESGINCADDLESLIAIGIKGVLIGETFMRESDIEQSFKKLFNSI